MTAAFLKRPRTTYPVMFVGLGAVGLLAVCLLAVCLLAFGACSGGRRAATDAGDASSPDVTMTTEAATETTPEVAPEVAGDVAPEAPVLTPGALMPRGYLTGGDSPFAGVDFAYFHLEDFEDHMLNTPGVASPGGRLSSTFPPDIIDSVDADDGNPTDNKCIKMTGTCDAWWGPGSLTFTFDAAVLGDLPTHVGVVWTDGDGMVSFEAFGPDGMSLYKFGPFSEPGFPDNTISSSTSEDRFFGAYAPGGISSIILSNTAGGVEADHLQYGRAR